MSIGNFKGTKITVYGLKDGETVQMWSGNILSNIKRDFSRATTGRGINKDGETETFAYCNVMKRV